MPNTNENATQEKTPLQKLYTEEDMQEALLVGAASVYFNEVFSEEQRNSDDQLLAKEKAVAALADVPWWDVLMNYGFSCDMPEPPRKKREGTVTRG